MLNIHEDLKSNDADKYFDNICDEKGHKLTKSAKRTKLMLLMRELYYRRADENQCQLSNGENVPIVIAKRHPKRGEFCYFNTTAAPAEEILHAFAARVNITCKLTRPEPKREGELIVADIRHLMDNVVVNGKKVSDVRKQQELSRLFHRLYHTPQDNICHLQSGQDIPIVVERLSVNNWNFYCLNTSENRTEVLAAFAAWAGCTYCMEKENAITPPEKHPHEMTARQCARIFHGVSNYDDRMAKRDASPKLVEWFARIYENPQLNQTILPDGTKVPLVVYRQSHSQKCLCLNTADEKVKPFVIKKMAEITEAQVCFANLQIHADNPLNLHKGIIWLAKAKQQARTSEEAMFYYDYAQKAWHVLAPNSKEKTVGEWVMQNILKTKNAIM